MGWRRCLSLTFLTSAFTGFFICTKAQSLTNLSAIQRGNDVIVTYQLDGDYGKAYTVSLYASNNDFGSPLRLVQGDVASKRVLPGSNKTITWRALDELRTFDGDISFEIRAVPAVPLFSNIAAEAPKVKRGKQIMLTWAGGLPREQIGIELVKEGETVNLGTMDNSGRFLYAVPKKMKTGTYAIRVLQGGEVTTGNAFKVQPKIPMLVKLVPLVAVGTVVVIVLNNKKTDEFPEPPDLTGN